MRIGIQIIKLVLLVVGRGRARLAIGLCHNIDPFRCSQGAAGHGLADLDENFVRRSLASRASSGITLCP